MNNSFFSQFAPKERKFYPLLKQLSEVLYEASALLIESFDFYQAEQRDDYYRKIKELEHEGDRISNLIFDELSVTFITPFDREDIHDLASVMDDVIDGMKSCTKRISIYNPKSIPQCGKELSLLVSEGAQCILNAIRILETYEKNSKAIKEYCDQLHLIEHEADDVYEHNMKRLFEEEKDCIELIKIKDIMLELEKITDSEERVGKILRSIIVKYA